MLDAGGHVEFGGVFETELKCQTWSKMCPSPERVLSSCVSHLIHLTDSGRNRSLPKRSDRTLGERREARPTL